MFETIVGLGLLWRTPPGGVGAGRRGKDEEELAFKDEPGRCCCPTPLQHTRLTASLYCSRVRLTMPH